VGAKGHSATAAAPARNHGCCPPAATVAAVTINPGWPVVAALLLLMAITLAAHRVAGFGLGRSALVAGLRACLQLGLAAVVITSVIGSLPLSLALAVVMFAMAVVTTCRRVEAPGSWPWAAAAMAGETRCVRPL